MATLYLLFSCTYVKIIKDDEVHDEFLCFSCGWFHLFHNMRVFLVILMPQKTLLWLSNTVCSLVWPPEILGYLNVLTT
jgi:hypothetical protein